MGERLLGDRETPYRIQGSSGGSTQFHTFLDCFHPAVVDDRSPPWDPLSTRGCRQVLASDLVIPGGIRHRLEIALDDPGGTHTLLGRFRSDLHTLSAGGNRDLGNRP